MSSFGKTDLPIQMQIKNYIYLIKRLRTFSLTLYRTRVSFVMIAVPNGLMAELKIWSRKKNIAKKCYLQNNSDIQLFQRFQSLQNFSTVTIEKSKQQVYSQISTRLMDPATSPQAYWSILKTFVNNKEILCIPPIYHNNDYITDCKKKAGILNNFFAKQCTTVNNTSKLHIGSLKRTNNCLPTISFTKDYIEKIIKSLDPSRGYGHDIIGIRMSKIMVNQFWSSKN